METPLCVVVEAEEIVVADAEDALPVQPIHAVAEVGALAPPWWTPKNRDPVAPRHACEERFVERRVGHLIGARHEEVLGERPWPIR